MTQDVEEAKQESQESVDQEVDSETNVQEASPEEVVNTESTVDQKVDNTDADTSVADKSESDLEENARAEKQAKAERQASHMRLVASAKEQLERENHRLEEEKRALIAKLEAAQAQKEKQAKLDAMDDIIEETGDFRTAEENAALKSEVTALRQDVHQLLSQAATEKAEKKVLQKYRDFEEVASEVNVSVLKSVDPEAFKQIVAEPDLYKKGVMAYEAIRKNKIYENAVEVAQNKEAIIKNIAKPKLTNSSPRMGSDQTSVFANLNSKEYQDQLRKELQDSLERA
jgi:hypothetical protein